jgi:flagellar secretion chaperone FliS
MKMYGNGSLIQKYQEQAVNTMSRGEQIVVLYDEVIKNLKYASMLIGKGDTQTAQKCMKKCRNILNYLVVVLDEKYDISKRLKAIYSYMIGQIVITEATGDASRIDAIIPKLAELREAWSEAEKSLHTHGSNSNPLPGHTT